MNPTVLLIDNYDSFVYNISQYLGLIGADLVVRRNQISISEVSKIDPDLIVISPGPGRPEEAGVSCRIIDSFHERPILGVCLGHQAIAHVFGAKIVKAPTPIHGKRSLVEHESQGLYAGVENPFSAVRYHSLVVSEDQFPSVLRVTSRTQDGVIMGLRHRKYPIEGVQFHPESILTMSGKLILRNFLEDNQ